MSAIRTRLTERFGLAVPIVSAPMALVAGGRLAAAVSRAGGLGLIGGGYGGALGGEPPLEDEWRAAGNEPVGVGFILWALGERRDAILDGALAREPRAMFLSFPETAGDLDTPARRVRDAGVPLIVQAQTLELAHRALDLGADAVVAQGTEAGGHGGARATLPFVPEVADLAARHAPDALVLAAGGIADGRGLAAALMLGADGAVVGSRLWASAEALTPPSHIARALAASGDDTVRTRRIDRARGVPWPADYSFRTLRNRFTDEVAADEPSFGEAAVRYAEARDADDAETVVAVAGEATGLIADRAPAGEIVARMGAEAAAALRRGASLAT